MQKIDWFRTISLAIMVAVILLGFALACASLSACTFKIEVPPWPDSGLLQLPPVQVPCVENVDAGWVCRWPDGGNG